MLFKTGVSLEKRFRGPALDDTCAEELDEEVWFSVWLEEAAAPELTCVGLGETEASFDV